ncbi:fibronectin type III-like domain-contianing protein [Streptomyces fulvoviolaceus]|uniref:fibronectin type III-like domain-contianing protein n=1 Tax=Streptomyces fulvoviolaceus TaxID=285535 RepID=UPI0021BE1D5C|nr:fibronectin type III-like domain-contianing protein [Streptomyces fulvoviolaceus]MCT9080745.1 hypothetical protein [Streptomyces fulvoviolaceus]
MTLTRAGRRPARETVQAHARDRVTSVTWTDREVKAFTQVGVEPGEWVEVMILVLAGDCTVVVARDAASSDRVSSISCSAAAHASMKLCSQY